MTESIQQFKSVNMKHSLLFSWFAFFLVSLSAQNAPVDFETGGNGAAWTWTVFENATNPPVNIIANPDMSGANTSATVAEFTALQAGNPWAGCETMHGADIGSFTLDASNSVVKIMVWKPTISDVGIKLVQADGAALPEIKVPNTVTNQWEELTFDFSGQIGTTFDQIVIFPDFDLGGRAQDNVCYFDNITFSMGTAPSMPMTAAPSPTEAAADVISMFSNTYTDVMVDYWLTVWSAAALNDIQIAGNDTKQYSSVNFFGIETTTSNIDASAMETFHFDLWTPDATLFKVKLVDLGADGSFGGGDDVEHELTYNAPPQSSWNSYDIPLADFTGLTTTSNIAQLIFVGEPTGTNTLYLDNIYFSKSPTTATSPATPAPDPTDDAANVISMFSNTYTDVAVDTWLAVWSDAALTDIQIAGNDTKQYDNVNFLGIETKTSTIDASAMEFFHLDMWTPDATVFKVKLVDFGADGGFGGGDDVEHELTFNAPTQGVWNSYMIPLSDFTGLTTTSNIAQLILVAEPTGGATLFVDNVYFSKSPTTATSPATPAPDPTDDAANVISMFSNTYTDVAVDTWLAVWSDAALTDIQIAGNDTKQYDNVNFLGIETKTSTIDASAMEFFHLDMWTPDATVFKVKLVDFGADATFGGGDDTEHELVFNTPTQGTWNSYMIPLTDFTGLTNTSNIAQLILVAEPTGGATLFVDNVYFSKSPTLATPMGPASDPTLDPADVISLYSGVYTDVPVDTWLTVWSAASLTDIQIMGNDTKLYENVDFLGVETKANQIDASAMNYFHFDVWTPNMTTFRVKWVDFGADGTFGGGDDVEHEIEYTSVATNTWVTYEIPMSDFTGLTTNNNLAQLIFSGLPTGSGVFYLDNVYFSKFSTSNTELSLAEVNMFPNPASQNLNLTSDEDMELVQLFDSAGRLVTSQIVAGNTATVNVANLPEGFYTCLITINGKNLAKPFIKK